MRFNTERLRKICQMKEYEFKKYGKVTLTKDGPYIFIGRGSNVLGVAHLDTVGSNRKVRFFESTKFGPGIQCQQLDDRLGAFVLLELLPQMGVNCDVLLTVGEESGLSTGAHFKPTKDYNWMFQFDRSGTDVVMYDYEDNELIQRVVDAGFVAGWGTFSDISMMEHMGIKAINVGVGYHMAHTAQCFAYLKDTASMVETFKEFYELNKDEHMEHEEVFGHKWGKTGYWREWEDNYGTKDDTTYPTGKSNYHPGLTNKCDWCGYWYSDYDMCEWDEECCKNCQDDTYDNEFTFKDDRMKECEYCGDNFFASAGFTYCVRCSITKDKVNDKWERKKDDDPYDDGWTEGQYKFLSRGGTGPYRGGH